MSFYFPNDVLFPQMDASSTFSPSLCPTPEVHIPSAQSLIVSPFFSSGYIDICGSNDHDSPQNLTIQLSEVNIGNGLDMFSSFLPSGSSPLTISSQISSSLEWHSYISTLITSIQSCSPHLSELDDNSQSLFAQHVEQLLGFVSMLSSAAFSEPNNHVSSDPSLIYQLAWERLHASLARLCFLHLRRRFTASYIANYQNSTHIERHPQLPSPFNPLSSPTKFYGRCSPSTLVLPIFHDYIPLSPHHMHYRHHRQSYKHDTVHSNHHSWDIPPPLAVEDIIFDADAYRFPISSLDSRQLSLSIQSSGSSGQFRFNRPLELDCLIEHRDTAAHFLTTQRAQSIASRYYSDYHRAFYGIHHTAISAASSNTYKTAHLDNATYSTRSHIHNHIHTNHVPQLFSICNHLRIHNEHFLSGSSSGDSFAGCDNMNDINISSPSHSSSITQFIYHNTQLKSLAAHQLLLLAMPGPHQLATFQRDSSAYCSSTFPESSDDSCSYLNGTSINHLHKMLLENNISSSTLFSAQESFVSQIPVRGKLAICPFSLKIFFVDIELIPQRYNTLSHCKLSDWYNAQQVNLSHEMAPTQKIPHFPALPWVNRLIPTTITLGLPRFGLLSPAQSSLSPSLDPIQPPSVSQIYGLVRDSCDSSDLEMASASSSRTVPVDSLLPSTAESDLPFPFGNQMAAHQSSSYLCINELSFNSFIYVLQLYYNRWTSGDNSDAGGDDANFVPMLVSYLHRSFADSSYASIQTSILAICDAFLDRFSQSLPSNHEHLPRFVNVALFDSAPSAASSTTTTFPCSTFFAYITMVTISQLLATMLFPHNVQSRHLMLSAVNHGQIRHQSAFQSRYLDIFVSRRSLQFKALDILQRKTFALFRDACIVAKLRATALYHKILHINFHLDLHRLSAALVTNMVAFFDHFNPSQQQIISSSKRFFPIAHYIPSPQELWYIFQHLYNVTEVTTPPDEEAAATSWISFFEPKPPCIEETLDQNHLTISHIETPISSSSTGSEPPVDGTGEPTTESTETPPPSSFSLTESRPFGDRFTFDPINLLNFDQLQQHRRDWIVLLLHTAAAASGHNFSPVSSSTSISSVPSSFGPHTQPESTEVSIPTSPMLQAPEIGEPPIVHSSHPNNSDDDTKPCDIHSVVCVDPYQLFKAQCDAYYDTLLSPSVSSSAPSESSSGSSSSNSNTASSYYDTSSSAVSSESSFQHDSSLGLHHDDFEWLVNNSEYLFSSDDDLPSLDSGSDSYSVNSTSDTSVEDYEMLLDDPIRDDDDTPQSPNLVTVNTHESKTGVAAPIIIPTPFLESSPMVLQLCVQNISHFELLFDSFTHNSISLPCHRVPINSSLRKSAVLLFELIESYQLSKNSVLLTALCEMPVSWQARVARSHHHRCENSFASKSSATLEEGVRPAPSFLQTLTNLVQHPSVRSSHLIASTPLHIRRKHQRRASFQDNNKLDVQLHSSCFLGNSLFPEYYLDNLLRNMKQQHSPPMNRNVEEKINHDIDSDDADDDDTDDDDNGQAPKFYPSATNISYSTQSSNTQPDPHSFFSAMKFSWPDMLPCHSSQHDFIPTMQLIPSSKQRTPATASSIAVTSDFIQTPDHNAITLFLPLIPIVNSNQSSMHEPVPSITPSAYICSLVQHLDSPGRESTPLSHSEPKSLLPQRIFHKSYSFCRHLTPLYTFAQVPIVFDNVSQHYIRALASFVQTSFAHDALSASTQVESDHHKIQQTASTTISTQFQHHGKFLRQHSRVQQSRHSSLKASKRVNLISKRHNFHQYAKMFAPAMMWPRLPVAPALDLLLVHSPHKTSQHHLGSLSALDQRVIGVIIAVIPHELCSSCFNLANIQLQASPWYYIVQTHIANHVHYALLPPQNLFINGFSLSSLMPSPPNAKLHNFNQLYSSSSQTTTPASICIDHSSNQAILFDPGQSLDSPSIVPSPFPSIHQFMLASLLTDSQADVQMPSPRSLVEHIRNIVDLVSFDSPLHDASDCIADIVSQALPLFPTGMLAIFLSHFQPSSPQSPQRLQYSLPFSSPQDRFYTRIIPHRTSHLSLISPPPSRKGLPCVPRGTPISVQLQSLHHLTSDDPHDTLFTVPLRLPDPSYPGDNQITTKMVRLSFVGHHAQIIASSNALHFIDLQTSASLGLLSLSNNENHRRTESIGQWSPFSSMLPLFARFAVPTLPRLATPSPRRHLKSHHIVRAQQFAVRRLLRIAAYQELRYALLMLFRHFGTIYQVGTDGRVYSPADHEWEIFADWLHIMVKFPVVYPTVLSSIKYVVPVEANISWLSESPGAWADLQLFVMLYILVVTSGTSSSSSEMSEVTLPSNSETDSDLSNSETHQTDQAISTQINALIAIRDSPSSPLSQRTFHPDKFLSFHKTGEISPAKLASFFTHLTSQDWSGDELSIDPVINMTMSSIGPRIALIIQHCRRFEPFLSFAKGSILSNDGDVSSSPQPNILFSDSVSLFDQLRSIYDFSKRVTPNWPGDGSTIANSFEINAVAPSNAIAAPAVSPDHSISSESPLCSSKHATPSLSRLSINSPAIQTSPTLSGIDSFTPVRGLEQNDKAASALTTETSLIIPTTITAPAQPILSNSSTLDDTGTPPIAFEPQHDHANPSVDVETVGIQSSQSHQPRNDSASIPTRSPSASQASDAPNMQQQQQLQAQASSKSQHAQQRTHSSVANRTLSNHQSLPNLASHPIHPSSSYNPEYLENHHPPPNQMSSNHLENQISVHSLPASSLSTSSSQSSSTLHTTSTLGENQQPLDHSSVSPIPIFRPDFQPAQHKPMFRNNNSNSLSRSTLLVGQQPPHFSSFHLQPPNSFLVLDQTRQVATESLPNAAGGHQLQQQHQQHHVIRVVPSPQQFIPPPVQSPVPPFDRSTSIPDDNHPPHSLQAYGEPAATLVHLPPGGHPVFIAAPAVPAPPYVIPLFPDHPPQIVSSNHYPFLSTAATATAYPMQITAEQLSSLPVAIVPPFLPPSSSPFHTQSSSLSAHLLTSQDSSQDFRFPLSSSSSFVGSTGGIPVQTADYPNLLLPIPSHGLPLQVSSPVTMGREYSTGPPVSISDVPHSASISPQPTMQSRHISTPQLHQQYYQQHELHQQHPHPHQLQPMMTTSPEPPSQLSFWQVPPPSNHQQSATVTSGNFPQFPTTAPHLSSSASSPSSVSSQPNIALRSPSQFHLSGDSPTNNSRPYVPPQQQQQQQHQHHQHPHQQSHKKPSHHRQQEQQSHQQQQPQHQQQHQQQQQFYQQQQFHQQQLQAIQYQQQYLYQQQQFQAAQYQQQYLFQQQPQVPQPPFYSSATSPGSPPAHQTSRFAGTLSSQHSPYPQQTHSPTTPHFDQHQNHQPWVVQQNSHSGPSSGFPQSSASSPGSYTNIGTPNQQHYAFNLNSSQPAVPNQPPSHPELYQQQQQQQPSVSQQTSPYLTATDPSLRQPPPQVPDHLRFPHN